MTPRINRWPQCQNGRLVASRSPTSSIGWPSPAGCREVIRTDYDKEFCGRTMLNWAHTYHAALRLIEPGKPNQNAYINSFNGRLRDECLNEHWFLNQAHAQTGIEAWRREYNEERPKKVLGGLIPAAYARQLAERTAKVATGL